MKVLHLSYSDLDGGAARGAYQQHQSLVELGVDSRMVVLTKLSSDDRVMGPTEQAQEMVFNAVRPLVDRFPLKAYPQKTTFNFSPAICPFLDQGKIAAFNPDLINLHWINKGFLRPQTLQKLGKPLVWTIRDMWPFTGGCHYTEDCDRFTQACGRCPQLQSHDPHDLSHRIWKRKQAAWTQPLPLHLVAVSHWIADCLGRSSLLSQYPRRVIPSTIDSDTFIPRDPQQARHLLNLDPHKQYLLFTALDPKDKRKGWDYLLGALAQLETQLASWENLELLVLGTTQWTGPRPGSLPIHCLGRLFDNLSLSLVYNAAHATIVPSRQDACPKTALESLACGVPVVSFDATGLRDLVDHQVNGYRAACFDVQDLAAGIGWVLEANRDGALRAPARQAIHDRFSSQHLAQQYHRLYAAILGINL